MEVNEFNVILIGVGGQGILTLLEIVGNAALKQGYEVKTAEVHGLSQRFGSIQAHLRFGKQIFSPLVMKNDADLIIALEPLEALRALKYASEKTTFLLNKYAIPPSIIYITNERYPTFEEIENEIKKISEKIYWVEATKKSIEMFGSAISTNIAILAFALKLNLIPISKENVIEAMRERWPDERFDKNKILLEEIIKS